MIINALKLYNKNERIVHVIMFLIGATLIPIGANLMINSHFGAAGIDAMNFILSDTFGIPVSVVMYITSFIFMLLAALVRRKPPRFFAMLSGVIQGTFTNIWQIVLSGIEGTTLASRAALFIIGIVVVAFFAAPYFLSLFPPTPGDDLVRSMSERRIRVGLAKIILEGSCAVIALLLHGEISIGTILVIIFLGPLIDIFRTLLQKVLNHFRVRYLLETQDLPVAGAGA